jgi:hypothetical protein
MGREDFCHNAVKWTVIMSRHHVATRLPDSGIACLTHETEGRQHDNQCHIRYMMLRCFIYPDLQARLHFISTVNW